MIAVIASGAAGFIGWLDCDKQALSYRTKSATMIPEIKAATDVTMPN